ncbi:6-pyruvoyl tetrahydropterin synthase [Schaalia odontolytica]|uniref:6-pyruvoyl tetrahydropterin synthase n=1 Tax=Schaalia odontolytica TaxID=1660 RepID=A0A2I1HZS9_9ACTO|nr:6-pyruvoyl tetrahydropterin synthase [Schaalia odontolytica]QCT36274.1 6-pyruvoyl tetrahydropterin synthase [Schaalia odontolytica]
MQLFSHRNSRLHGHEVVTQYRDQWSQVKPSPYFFPTCGAVT